MAARATLADDLKRCRLIREIEDGYPDPPTTGFETAVVGTLRAAVAVLMVASFEEFVRSVFAENLDLLLRPVSGFSLSKYHSQLHLESIFCGLQRALDGDRSGKRRDLSRRPEIMAICNIIIGDEIVVDALSDVGANPKGTRIVKMLERVGLKSPSDALDKRYAARHGPCAAGYVVARLDSIVNLRHSVAHTGRALIIPRTQLDDNLLFLAQAAEVIEATLTAFVRMAKANAAKAGPSVKKIAVP